jgi:hypothetical protein
VPMTIVAIGTKIIALKVVKNERTIM